MLSELTAKQVADISSESATKAVEAYKATQITRRLVNKGYDAEDKLKERYFVNKDSEYSSTTKFFRDVMMASVPGGMESDELRGYVKKTSGYMEEGDLSQGGYACPTDLASQILERAIEKSIVRPRATSQPMSSSKLEIPADVDENHQTNYFGGITIYRTGEAAPTTATNPQIGKVKLQLHKLMGLVHCSDELLEDSPALEAWLIRKFANSIAFVEDSDFLVGDGVNKALGMFHSKNPALITVDAETGQGNNTVVAENIISLWSRLYPDGQANAIWVANINTFKQLAKMGIAVGAGGIPVWMPANQLAGKPYRELMGAPIFFTEKLPSLGSAGDVCVCDPTQYLVGDRSGGEPKIASSIHLKFDYDLTSFRFVLRYDGQPSWLSTLTPKQGSDTLSPYIVLNSSRA